MRQLLIIGARGFGREIFNMLPDCLGYGKDFIVKGFLDDKVDALDGHPGFSPIIDSVEQYIIQPDDVFICALGDVRWKKYYVELILSKGGEFINLIHKNSTIRINTKIGVGCIISDNVLLSCDVSIGNFVTFLSFSIIGHDVVVGDYCHLASFTFLGGGAMLGNLSTVHPGARVLPHIKVGGGSTIGAGSVVIRNVKDSVTVFGNPAKILDV